MSEAINLSPDVLKKLFDPFTEFPKMMIDCAEHYEAILNSKFKWNVVFQMPPIYSRIWMASWLELRPRMLMILSMQKQPVVRTSEQNKNFKGNSTAPDNIHFSGDEIESFISIFCNPLKAIIDMLSPASLERNYAWFRSIRAHLFSGISHYLEIFVLLQ